MTRKATFALFAPLVVVLVIVDRLTKVWAAGNLAKGVIGYDFGPVAFTLVHNRGAAFGMGQGGGWLFVIVALVICVAAVLWLAHSKENRILEVVSLALIVAGGVGNLIDRLTTEYVVDFIKFTFIDFPVFNVADICVTCGVVLFIITIFFTTFRAGEGDK